jgi:hypothetical protein
MSPFCPPVALCGWQAHERISGLDPEQASPMSGRRFLAPLIAETRRRIADDRRAMAEPGSIE